MMEYKELKELFDTARNKEKGKPWGNNTRIMQRWIDDVECYAVRLHQTDVVTVWPDESYQLDSGGWQTRTTKDRMNLVIPTWVSMVNGIWYVGDSLYYDGMILDRLGKPTAPQDSKYLELAKAEIDRRVRNYVAGFKRLAKTESGIPEPGAGDCLYCQMVPKDRTGHHHLDVDLDHIFMHMEEKYYVSSLLMKAIVEKGYQNPGLIWGMVAHAGPRGTTRMLSQILTAYFRRRKIEMARVIEPEIRAKLRPQEMREREAAERQPDRTDIETTMNRPWSR